MYQTHSSFAVTSSDLFAQEKNLNIALKHATQKQLLLERFLSHVNIRSVQPLLFCIRNASLLCIRSSPPCTRFFFLYTVLCLLKIPLSHVLKN